MIASTDLFDLIKSLKKSELAYFQKHSSVFIREGRNKYMQLFDAIAALDNYDEDKIVAQFKGEKFTRQFSVAKNYLYNRILDTMQSYHQSILSEVHGLMNKAEYLFEKGLYKQSDKILRMAEKLARKHELHSILITLQEYQQFDYSMKKREPRNAEKNIEHSQKEIPLLNNHLEYLKLLAKTQHVYNLYGKTKNKKYLGDFKKIMRSPLLKDESRALTFNGKRRFYDIHAVYNSVIENEIKAYRYSQKIISLYDSNLEKKEGNAVIYAGYINNTLLFCHFLRKFSEMENYLGKLAEIKPLMNTKYQKARLFEIFTTNYLNLYNTTGQFEKAGEKLPSFILELPEHQKKLADRDKRLLYGNIANTFFGLQQYKNCLVWVNKIRNELSATIRPDLDSEIRLMNIIVHYELKHEDIIPHLVTSYYRFLRKKEMVTHPENYLLSFFRKLSASDTETKLLREMNSLRDQITAVVKKHSRKADYTPFFFDIISWLESKIEKKTFSEIVKEKATRFR